MVISAALVGRPPSLPPPPPRCLLAASSETVDPHLSDGEQKEEEEDTVTTHEAGVSAAHAQSAGRSVSGVGSGESCGGESLLKTTRTSVGRWVSDYLFLSFWFDHPLKGIPR